MMKTLTLSIVLTFSTALAQNPIPVSTASTSVNPERSGPAFEPDSVKILGTLDYGQTRDADNCADSYKAFVFPGYGGDQVEIQVDGAENGAFVALADSSLHEVTRGTAQLRAALPNYGPDLEVWYIIFRNSDSQAASLRVSVKKTGADQNGGGEGEPPNASR